MNVNEISSDMENFVAAFQEISASVNEINTAVAEMAHETENTTEFVARLGSTVKNVEDIKEKIHQIDGDFLDNNKKYYTIFQGQDVEISSSQLLEILDDAIDQHRTWINRLKGAVDKLEITPLQTDSSRCGFGHFYQTLNIRDEELKALWLEIDGYHEKLHIMGEKALTSIWNKDYPKAREDYKIVEAASSQVFRIIDEMKAMIRN